MAASYNLTFTNGTVESPIMDGSYTSTTNSTGYDETTGTVNVIDGTNSYTVTAAASGTLTLHVTDTGTAGGTAITTASFYRTDSTGVAHYGDVHSPNGSGNVVFANVPYAAASAPDIYIIQTASDGYHTFTATRQTFTMTASTSTVEIQNPPPPSRTITLQDQNYSGLVIQTGTLGLVST